MVYIIYIIFISFYLLFTILLPLTITGEVKNVGSIKLIWSYTCNLLLLGCISCQSQGISTPLHNVSILLCIIICNMNMRLYWRGMQRMEMWIIF